MKWGRVQVWHGKVLWWSERVSIGHVTPSLFSADKTAHDPIIELMFFTHIQLVSNSIPFVNFFYVSGTEVSLGIAGWINAIHKNAFIFLFLFHSNSAKA